MPTLTCGRLNYIQCARIFNGRRFEERDYRNIHSKGNYAIYRDSNVVHPVTNQRVQRYRLRMYNTNILSFYEDGTVKVIDFNSVTTTQVLNAHGPSWLRVHSNSNHSGCTRRWGSGHWPLSEGEIVVDGQGRCHTRCVDTFRRVRADAKPERSRIRRHFREVFSPHIMLGEYDGVLVQQDRVTKLWTAHLPRIRTGDRGRLFSRLVANADFAEIYARVGPGGDIQLEPLGNYFTGGGKAIHYDSQRQASEAVINALLTAALADPGKYIEGESSHYEDYEVVHDNIEVCL
jgi:hypothetical protein